MLFRSADVVRDAFECAVIVIHHCGHGGDRPRGHSALLGAYDALIAVKRDAADHVVAELEGSKDGAAGLQLVSLLKQVEIGIDDDGDPVTTCVIEPAYGACVAGAAAEAAKTVPPTKRLLLDVITEVSGDAGVDIRPFVDGPLIKAVSAELVRARYYSRVAEKPKDDDTPEKLAERQRKSFNNAVKDLLDRELITAGIWNGERYLWPR